MFYKQKNVTSKMGVQGKWYLLEFCKFYNRIAPGN
jgi:hypothetical protein